MPTIEAHIIIKAIIFIFFILFIGKFNLIKGLKLWKQEFINTGEFFADRYEAWGKQLPAWLQVLTFQSITNFFMRFAVRFFCYFIPIGFIFSEPNDAIPVVMLMAVVYFIYRNSQESPRL